MIHDGSEQQDLLSGSPLGMYEHPINHGTNLPNMHRILSTVCVETMRQFSAHSWWIQCLLNASKSIGFMVHPLFAKTRISLPWVQLTDTNSYTG